MNGRLKGAAAVNFGQLNPILGYFVGGTAGCNYTVSYSSNGTRASITGNFVFASQLKPDPSCITASTEQVTIHAWGTFFLDTPINAKSLTGEGPFNLVIIARKFKSLGHNIDLSGRNGEPPTTPVAAMGYDGADGTRGQSG